MRCDAKERSRILSICVKHFVKGEIVEDGFLLKSAIDPQSSCVGFR